MESGSVKKFRQELRSQVNGNGVHAGNQQRLHPFLSDTFINEPDKNSQYREIQAGHERRKGIGPELLVDRQLDVPNLAKSDQKNARNQQTMPPHSKRNGEPQDVARHDAQKRRTDSRESAHDAFWIPRFGVRIVVRTQDDVVYIVREIAFHAEVPWPPAGYRNE